MSESRQRLRGRRHRAASRDYYERPLMLTPPPAPPEPGRWLQAAVLLALAAGAAGAAVGAAGALGLAALLRF